MIKLFLIGMPGAGKSLLGRKLAEFLGISHMDTDDMVEKRAGKDIPDILLFTRYSGI